MNKYIKFNIFNLNILPLKKNLTIFLSYAFSKSLSFHSKDDGVFYLFLKSIIDIFSTFFSQ